MSLTLTEFQAQIAPLLGHRLEAHLHSVELAIGTGRVVVAYEPRPSVRFGGLLELPRALVSLTFDDVTDSGQSRFVERFDRAFQRGGG